MSDKTQNDLAWEEILGELTFVNRDIDKKGYCDIGSEVIKKYREPRLACKIDYRQNMPKPLKEEKLSVLAIKNKYYRLAKTDPFINIDERRCAESKFPDCFTIPEHIQVLAPQNFSSESKALDAAFISGMLNDVVGDRLSPVLRGREYCRRIDFSLPDREKSRLVNYEVEKVQLEVDGGYEGQSGIYLFEAKSGLSDNMNLRQLLYPQLHYQKLFNTQKGVNTYVMFYERGRGYFHFFRFIADDEYHVDDYRCCALSGNSSLRVCWDDLRAVEVDSEQTGHSAPFPQANSLDKILDIFLKLFEAGPLTNEDLFYTYNLVPRQYYYYVDALRWMGLVERISGSLKTEYQLTSTGLRIAKKPEIEIMYEMAKIIFSNELCNCFVHDHNPNIPQEMRARNGLGNSDKTFRRRMATIRRWRKYFQKIERAASISTPDISCRTTRLST